MVFVLLLWLKRGSLLVVCSLMLCVDVHWWLSVAVLAC